MCPELDAAFAAAEKHEIAHRAAETPPLWTEAHCREATRRTFELAAGLAEADRAEDAAWISINVLHMTRSEADWRLSLGLPRDRGGRPPLDPSRIDREVAIVRERVEQPCLVCHEVGFHKMSCYPQNREDARRRREQASDDLRAQLAAAKELLRASEPVVAAAEALADVWEARRDGRLAAVANVVAAVKAARNNRVEDHAPIFSEGQKDLARRTLEAWGNEPGDALKRAVVREARRVLGADPSPPTTAWTTPPGVAVEVLHGSVDGPLLIALVTLDPGAEVLREIHEKQAEMILGLHGCLRFEVDGSPYGGWKTNYGPPAEPRLSDLAPATFLLPGEPHTIRNPSKTAPALYLAILRRVAPTPASCAVLSDALKNALRLCCDDHAEEWSDTKNGLQEQCRELRDLGLVDEDWNLTPTGRAALTALDAEPVTVRRDEEA